MNEARRDQVFISYAHENLDTVQKVVAGLKLRGLKVWFDKEHIYPGKWKSQIFKAINHSRYFIICLSEAALRKTGDIPGFQDDELQEAYEIAKTQSETEFTIVPVRLENCARGDYRVRSFQQYKLYPDIEKGLDRLAIDIGGISMAKIDAKDARSEEEKIIDRLLGKAQAAYFAGDDKAALSILNNILAKYPNYTKAMNMKGLSLGTTGRYSEALQAYEKAIEQDPDDPDAWSGKGACLDILDRSEESLEAFKRVVELDPCDPVGWFGKGNALRRSGCHDEAWKAFEKAIELDPDDARAWSGKGLSLTGLKRYDEALQASEKAIKLDPSDGLAWLGKGIALLESGDYEESLQALNKTTEFSPDNAGAWWNKGFALKALGRRKEAKKAFKRAAKLDSYYKKFLEIALL